MYLYLTIAWIVILGFFYKFSPNFIIAKNWVSFVHASTVVIFYLTNCSESNLFYISCAYYFLDTVYTLYYFKGIFDFGLILHHIFTIAAITYLDNKEVSEYVRFIFFIAELSNLPMYFAEYFEMVANKKLARIFILVEIISYTNLRLMFGLYVMYDIVLLGYPVIIIIAGIIIYIATFVLVISQIKKFCNYF